MRFPLASLTVFAVLGAMPVVAHPAPSHVVRDSMPSSQVWSDSTPLLTADALARMTAFWIAFQQEPQAVRDTGSATLHNREKIQFNLLTLFQGDHVMGSTEVVNMVAMAAQYPSVAADFTQAGLTPQQWEAWRNALMATRAEVSVRRQSPASSPLPPTSVVAKNIALLKASRHRFRLLEEVADVWNGHN